MDEREREVRRRIASQELYRDADPGLDGLAEERVRGKEIAHEFNATRPRRPPSGTGCCANCSAASANGSGSSHRSGSPTAGTPISVTTST